MTFPTLKNGFHTQKSAQESAYDIFMYGVIGYEINVQNLMQEINSIPSGVKTLNFYVHTPGGLLYDGLAMLTNLERLKSQYHTRMHIDGVAASMGSAFVVQANETIASPTSQMMIHDPMANLDIYGGFNRQDILELIEDLEDLYGELESDSLVFSYPYAQKTGLTVEQVQEKWLADGKNHWLTPEMMLNEGLIDSIANEELPKPPEYEEVEEEDFLATIAMDLAQPGGDWGAKAASYRGKNQKIITAFASKNSNPDNSSEQKTGQKTERKTKSSSSMKFATIAKACSLDPASDEQSIVNYINALHTEVENKEGKIEQQQNLIDDLKTTKAKLEGRVSSLETDLRESKVGSEVDAVISKVAENQEGKEVNKNIRANLEDLAKSKLKAEAEGDEVMAGNLSDHMELLAKDNLIPIGEDPNLSDDGPTARTTVEGGLSQDRLAKAAEEGKKAAEKEKKRLQKTGTLN